MCGIAGYCGSKKPDISKLKLLSINLLERGKEGMGCLINNCVTRGIYEYQNDLSDPVKFFSHFWFRLPKSFDSNTVIIHNRAPTRGVRSLANTHPFEYLKEHDSENIETLFFTKNGTITNEQELCNLYGLNKSDFEVDSKLLGHIIIEHGWDVLTQYKGGAAMVLYSVFEPNTVYIFKGQSLNGDLLEEERPLYYYQTKDGMYFASTSRALQCALDIPSDNIQSFESNYLYKITDGKIIEKTLYDRSQVQNKVVLPPSLTHQSGRKHTTYNGSSTKLNNVDSPKEDIKKYYYGKNEPSPVKSVGGKKVYYWNGLYHRNGHPVSGIIKLNDFGEEVQKDVLGTTYYFHKGMMLKTESCIAEANKIVTKTKQIKDNITELLPLFSINFTTFIYKHSPARNMMKMYVYSGCQEVTAAKIQSRPLFSIYKYNFDIFNNCFTIEPLKFPQAEDLFSGNANEDSWDPRTWKSVDTEMLNANFKNMTVTEENEVSKKLNIICKYLNACIKKCVINNNTNDEKEMWAIRVILVLRQIANNPEFADMLFEELEEEIYQTIIEDENK